MPAGEVHVSRINLNRIPTVIPGTTDILSDAVHDQPELVAIAKNAIVHHGRLDPGVLLLVKPYRKADLARMIRTAIDASARSACSGARSRRAG